jgi:hypothetical protein
MRSSYRTLATLTELLGAKLGANGQRYLATSSHNGPSLLQVNGLPSPIGRCPATRQICFWSRRPPVRIRPSRPVQSTCRPFYDDHREVIEQHRECTLDFATGQATQRRYMRAKVIDEIFYIEGRGNASAL